MSGERGESRDVDPSIEEVMLNALQAGKKTPEVRAQEAEDRIQSAYDSATIDHHLQDPSQRETALAELNAALAETGSTPVTHEDVAGFAKSRLAEKATKEQEPELVTLGAANPNDLNPKKGRGRRRSTSLPQEPLTSSADIPTAEPIPEKESDKYFRGFVVGGFSDADEGLRGFMLDNLNTRREKDGLPPLSSEEVLQQVKEFRAQAVVPEQIENVLGPAEGVADALRTKLAERSAQDTPVTENTSVEMPQVKSWAQLKADRGETLDSLAEAPAVETVPASLPAEVTTPETVTTSPEGVAEVEHREDEPQEGSLQLSDARERYASALRSKKKWLGAAKPAELEAARQAYIEVTSNNLIDKVKEVKAAFAGKDLTSPEGQAEFQAQLISVTMEHRIGEEQKFRESLRDGEHKRLIDSARTWWKKHTKARMVIGGAMIAGGVVGAMSGQLWISAALAGARGILSGTGTFLATESAGQGIRKNFGDTKERSEADLEKLQQQALDGDDRVMRRQAKEELERLVAAHTMRQVDEGLEEFGVTKKGIFKKKNDETGKKLLESYDLVIRTQQEQEIQDQLKRGVSVEDVVTMHIKAIGAEREILHSGYITRIKSNKKWNAIIGTIAGVAGVGVGTLGISKLADHLGGADKASEAGKTVADKLIQEAAVQQQGAPDLSPESFLKAAQGSADAHSGPQEGSPEDFLKAVAVSDQTATTVRPIGSGVAKALQEAAPKSWADVRIGDDETYKAALEASKHVEVAKPGESTWKLVEHFVDKRGATLSAEQRTWLIDSIKDKIAANPELVGLKDADLIQPGQAIDFDKLGLDYSALTEKATNLSPDVVATIGDQSASAVEGIPDVDVSTVTEVPASEGTSAVADTSGKVVRRLEDMPVMVEAPDGRLIDLQDHLRSSTEAVSEMAPELVEQTKQYHDALTTWGVDKTPEVKHVATEALKQLTVKEALEPGSIEKAFATSASNDPLLEQRLGQLIRGLLKSLPEVGPKEKVGDILLKLEQVKE